LVQWPPGRCQDAKVSQDRDVPLATLSIFMASRLSQLISGPPRQFHDACLQAAERVWQAE
jgi:hypothetical protein